MSLPLMSSPTKYTSIGVFENNGANDIFQIVGPDGAVQVHMNATGLIDPPLGLQTALVTLSSAQILALHGSATAVLIPKLAATGLFIVPQYFTAIYDAGSTPYSGASAGGFFNVGWGDTVTAINNSLLLSAALPTVGFVDQASSQVYVSGFTTSTANGIVPAANAVNQDVSIYLDVDTLTLGNGSIDFIISYVVLQS